MFRNRLFGTVIVCVALVAAACSSDGGSQDGTTIVIGSASFGESELLAEIYAQALEDKGFPVERKFGVGSREIYATALESGELHLVPEYIGSALTYLGGTASSDVEATTEALREAWSPKGISVLEPADAQDKNGFVITESTATALGATKVSDLAAAGGSLVLGGPPECPERPFCLIGLQDVYGLTFASFRPLDTGGPLTVTALKEGEIDVGLLFTTDGVIAAEGFVLLEDDKGLQPAESIVPAIATSILDEYGDDLTEALNAVSAKLTTAGLTEMNRLVGYVGDDPVQVATDWLKTEGLID
ncbi:MAG: ABC transporter substrate-binding protein [Acidimicrobiia bacterium]